MALKAKGPFSLWFQRLWPLRLWLEFMSALYLVFKTFFLGTVLRFGVLSFQHFCLWAKGSGPPGGPGLPTVVGGVAPSARPWVSYFVAGS